MSGGDRPVIVLATSNGHGMGHLTRQLTVALALADRAHPLVFSLSLAMPVVAAHGLTGEYCPSYDRGWLPGVAWHRYLRDRLVALVEEVGARVVLFDGVAPYLGLLQARSRLPGTAFVWSRRGMWVPGFNDRALAAAPFFDLVVEPGDLASAADRGPTAVRDDAVRVAAVSLLEQVTPLPRTQAAAALGLDPRRPTVLVTLGSGTLGAAADAGEAALSALLADPAWQIVVTRAGIARTGLPLVDADRVVELRAVYPLARYLSAFDAAVSAAGYNAIHEFLPAAIPTLVVPNPTRSTDDQEARARQVAALGLALLAAPDDPAAVQAGARALSDPTVRLRLSEACRAVQDADPPRGGGQTAELLLDLASGDRRHRPTARERLRAAELEVRAGAMDLLGPRGTAAVRRALGRTPPAGPRRRLPVWLVPEPPGVPSDAPLPDPVARYLAADDVPAEDEPRPLLVTDRVDPDLVRHGPPLEHLLPGGSAAYRARRLALAARHYDVRPGPPPVLPPSS